LTKAQDKACAKQPLGLLGPSHCPHAKNVFELGKHKGMCQATPGGYLAPPTDPMPKVFIDPDQILNKGFVR